jgi:hypothetical protein
VDLVVVGVVAVWRQRSQRLFILLNPTSGIRITVPEVASNILRLVQRSAGGGCSVGWPVALRRVNAGTRRFFKTMFYVLN